ncbi:MAG: hypothetical protein ACRDV8_07885, partial [Acidimicrobiales bacterium]
MTTADPPRYPEPPPNAPPYQPPPYPPGGSPPYQPPPYPPGGSPPGGWAYAPPPIRGVPSLPPGVTLAPAGRRIGAYFLGLLLLIVTLVIGYVIWGL